MRKNKQEKFDWQKFLSALSHSKADIALAIENAGNWDSDPGARFTIERLSLNEPADPKLRELLYLFLWLLQDLQRANYFGNTQAILHYKRNLIATYETIQNTGKLLQTGNQYRDNRKLTGKRNLTRKKKVV